MIIYHNTGLFRILHITFFNFIDKGISQCAFFKIIGILNFNRIFISIKGTSQVLTKHFLYLKI